MTKKASPPAMLWGWDVCWLLGGLFFDIFVGGHSNLQVLERFSYLANG